MKKRLLAGVLAGVLAVGALTACGSSNPQSSTAAQTEAGTEAAGTEAAGETTAANGELTLIKVAASATPHAESDTIAVPNDTTNEARALLLLQDNGIITLKDGAGLEATVNDIAENPKNIKIQELEAAQVARVTGEVAYVVLNGNYALEAGYSVGKDALAYEKSDSEAAKTYVNVIAVKEGNENNPAIKALVDTLKSDTIKQYINDTYDGAVIPFED